jgi:hypothetical protein
MLHEVAGICTAVAHGFMKAILIEDRQEVTSVHQIFKIGAGVEPLAPKQKGNRALGCEKQRHVGKRSAGRDLPDRAS